MRLNEWKAKKQPKVNIQTKALTINGRKGI